MILTSVLIFSFFNSNEARPMASSPTRLPEKPPPKTRRSASLHSFSLRKRCSTPASSCAKDSIALCTMPADTASPLASKSSSFFLASFAEFFLAERILADAPQRLTPFVDELTKCGFAGAVADKSVLIFQLDIIAQHLDGRQPSRAVRQCYDCGCWFLRHCKLNKAADKRFGDAENFPSLKCRPSAVSAPLIMYGVCQWTSRRAPNICLQSR